MYAVGLLMVQPGCSKYERDDSPLCPTPLSDRRRVLPRFKKMLLSVCWCQQDEILRNDFEGPNADGSYKFAYQTQGGIYHEQRGSLQGQEPALVVEGQYQYTAPDGQVINVIYKADENGFQATGDHLPTPPPIPPAIQRALDYIKSLPPSDNDY